MNQSEFMAMLDDRMSDGHDYPTLDDYTDALAELSRQESRVEINHRAFVDATNACELRAREAVARQAERAVVRLNTFLTPEWTTANDGTTNRPRSAAPPPIRPVGGEAHHVRRCYRLEMRTAGVDWARTDPPFTEEASAQERAAALRRWQPHVQVRIVPTEERL